MVNANWQRTRIPEFKFSIDVEDVKFMKHKNHQADLSKNIGMILRFDARNKNSAMYRVLF
jgi:hypothetical protein